MNDGIWAGAESIKRELVASGWRTPDTYGNSYDEAGEFPAVYLFLMTNRECFERGFVAYVGMSQKLSVRWASHSILSELSCLPHWTQRWFKRVDSGSLRATEGEYIKKFDPPWNVNGRTRGVILQ